MHPKFTIIAILFITACTSAPSGMERTMLLAGDNGKEIEKVVTHYDSIGDSRGIEAARLLIENLYTQIHYEGDIMDAFTENVCTQDTATPIPNEKEEAMKRLVAQYGTISPQKLKKVYDCQTINAETLIDNIDNALASREKAPSYVDTSWATFCEYILPYKAGDEKPETFREKYAQELKTNIDTTNSIEELLVSLHQEFTYRRAIRSSQTMWNMPVSISVSQMERARIGSCKQLTEYGANVMRSCGIPVGIDHAIWNNRSLGHSWNFVVMADGTTFPFDTFGRYRYKLAYKPAKVYRRSYYSHTPSNEPKPTDIPANLINEYETDVTSLYVPTSDVKIAIKNAHGHKHAIICGFDNQKWIPVHYGEIKNDTATFTNLGNDGIYLAALWEDGKIIPAGEPIILNKDGSRELFVPDRTQTTTMTLKRKYPRMERTEMFAIRMIGTRFEASNSQDFKHHTILHEVEDKPYDFVDTTLTTSTAAYKFIRIHPADRRDGDIAEVEIYGKENANSTEKRLTGKITANCEYVNDINTADKAFDGNAETYFSKKRETEGWITMELDRPYIITRIRYCPRSDTNFIEIGDTYELCYWEDGKWVSHGRQKATANKITFDNVPTNTCYILHDLTKGKEERIFTYKNEEQIWW